nr:hypothetical protein [Tanacetum cinerariifolium]
MDQQYPIVAKIHVLDTGKFEQWQFRIQQYLQHEHYDLWEVIEFGDSYTVPASSSSTTTTDTTSDESGSKSGRTVTLTAEDMQKKKNDVKPRTTLLLSLLDEHQLRFSKYKTARELWAAILKTFGGNEATKKTKKNLLKQQYGNFKAEGSKTLEQTFNRLQVIVEWLMHTIVWRNRSDLDTMSLDDLYNHLKDYESEVQKKSKPNSQNLAFISLAKHSSGNKDGNTACVPTASTNIDEDDMEEMDIKWNMALLSMRSSQKPGQEKERQLQTESYMANNEDDHALVSDEVAPTEFSLMANTSAGSKVFDNSLCSKDSLAQVECRLVEYKEREVKYCEKIRTLEFHNESDNKCIEILKKKLETLKEEKERVDGKLAGLLKTSKDLDNLIKSQRSNKIKDGLGYSVIPPPPTQLYLSPKKDLSWTGLPEFDKAAERSTTNKVENVKKPAVRYAELYRKLTKKSTVRGNQRNWNNLKSYQLGSNFVRKNRACFNYGHFDNLSYDCGLGVKRGTTRPQNSTHKSMPPRPAIHIPYRPPMKTTRPNSNAATRPYVNSTRHKLLKN